MLIKKSLQYEVFPGGQPSRYYPRPTGFDFGDRTSPGFFLFFFLFLKDPRAGLVNAVILQIFNFLLITITLLVSTILRQKFFILFYFYKI